MTAKKTPADFDQSLALTISTLKDLREKGHPQKDLTASLKGFLFNHDYFETNKRQSALKKVNAALGTSITMGQVSNATVLGSKPEKDEKEPAETKAVHTDALQGKVEVKPRREMKDSIEMAQALVNLIEARVPVIAERGADGREELYQQFIEELDEEAQDAFSQIVTKLDVELAPVALLAPDLILSDFAMNEFIIIHAREGKSFDTFLTEVAAAQINPNPEEPRQELNLENDNMTTSNTAPLSEQLLAKSPLRNGAAFGSPEHDKTREIFLTPASQAFLDLLAQAGIHNDDDFAAAEAQFLSANPELVNDFLVFAKGRDKLSRQAIAEEFLKKNPALTQKFTGHIYNEAGAANTSAKVEATAETLSQRALRSMRGNRNEGFGSGAVAVVGALIGGGVEMVTRGGLTVGSGVGVAAGAAAAYFAAEKVEGLMGSEPGRYILSGSIGLIAGSIGSSVGRRIESGGIASVVPGGDETLQRLPEAIRPAPAQTTTAADGIAALFAIR